MNKQIVTEAPAERQAPALATANEHVSLGTWHLYNFLRCADWPLWDDLTAHQQAKIRSAFLIGASSVDRAAFRPQ